MVISRNNARLSSLRNPSSQRGISPKTKLTLFLIGVAACVVLNVSLLAQYVIRGEANVAALNGSSSKPVVVAHVVSLIKCSKKSSVTGFLDAAAVLRHSIHQQSVHGPNSPSKYSYQMYAIVHENCREHAHALDRLGYNALVKPSPITPDELPEGYLKNHIEQENCCGSAEFIKLYAYTLMDHPISVHWDMDVAIFQPMDDLYDSMLYPSSSPIGRQARSRLELQHPERKIPDKIDAFLTKDITSSKPWEKRQAVQGGFLVARPQEGILERYMAFIREGNYTKGRGEGTGWYGMGYGGFQGAMAYQGVVAYFYDQLAPDTAVELDVCVWNQVVADVIWRGPAKMEHYGQCRDHPRMGGSYEMNTPENGKCRDCRALTDVKSAHYTACKKPWECKVPHPRVPRDKAEVHRLQELTNITTCGVLFHKWFELRHGFEDLLQKTGGVQPAPRNGSFRREFFAGSCRGIDDYIPMIPPPEDFDSKLLYGF
eukprot:Nitzschia sp. Nitz4//scaffold16_size188269//78434//80084//NITZ4_001793-RA/size188269-augustus-gene-0.77-mRNA-1//1//CDS//3329538523//9042//frame0